MIKLNRYLHMFLRIINHLMSILSRASQRFSDQQRVKQHQPWNLLLNSTSFFMISYLLRLKLHFVIISRLEKLEFFLMISIANYIHISIYLTTSIFPGCFHIQHKALQQITGLPHILSTDGPIITTDGPIITDEPFDFEGYFKTGHMLTAASLQ